MNFRYYLLLSLLLSSSGVLFAQNADSVKAYIREFLEPTPNFVLTYGTGSMSLEYVKQAPLSPLSEEYIEEKKAEFERTGDPMELYTVAQTYRRMNRHEESEEWTEKALLETESLMINYPDSIKYVETAFLIYLDNGQSDLASLAAKMVANHYENSESLLAEVISYTFTGEYDLGIVIANRGLELYPDKAEWYMVRIIHEFTKKMSSFELGSEEFSAEENRIDRSFLKQGLSSFPNNLDIELVSVLGDFFLFGYEDVIPEFYNQLDTDEVEIEGFKFNLGPSLSVQLDEHLQKVTKLSKRKEFKNWHSIYYTLGMIQMFRSEYKIAASHFEKAIDLMKPEYRSSQDNVYHYYDNLIMCHQILGDLASAEKCAKRKATEEINMDPVPINYLEMARYRIADDDLTSAMKLINQAFEMDSTVIDLYSHKALLLMLMDKADDAFELFVAAESIDQNDIFTFKAVVLFHLLKGNAKDALAFIGQLENYDPTDDFITDARRLLETE